MDNLGKVRRARKWAIAAVAVLGLAAVLVQPNLASPVQEKYVGHTLQCLDWLLHDFPRHQKNCVGDSFVFFDLPDVQTYGSPPGPATVLPPEPEVPDPCDEVSALVPVGNAGNAGSGGCLETGLIAPFAASLFGGGMVNI